MEPNHLATAHNIKTTLKRQLLQVELYITQSKFISILLDRDIFWYDTFSLE